MNGILPLILARQRESTGWSEPASFGEATGQCWGVSAGFGGAVRVHRAGTFLPVLVREQGSVGMGHALQLSGTTQEYTVTAHTCWQ